VNEFKMTTEQGVFVFTQPDAGGVMYCNDVACSAAGQLAGPHPYRVGHRTLRDAAQKWYLDRVPLIEAYGKMTGQAWPFMKQEDYSPPLPSVVAGGTDQPDGQPGGVDDLPRPAVALGTGVPGWRGIRDGQ